jgi:hypothetical protein
LTLEFSLCKERSDGMGKGQAEVIESVDFSVVRLKNFWSWAIRENNWKD